MAMAFLRTAKQQPWPRWSSSVVILWLVQISHTLQCYECSDFPREPESQDENLGPCPGWQRPAKYYGLTSLYDGCMTVKLAHNGTVLAQNAVIYSQCLEYQRNVPQSLKLHLQSVRIRCCKESKCNAPKRYRWWNLFQEEQQMRWNKMDDHRIHTIANSESKRETPNDMHCSNNMLLAG